MIDEATLLEAASLGDHEAFGQLYQYYNPKILKFINGMLNSKEDSEEILHDIFIDIWEKKEKLLEIESFNSYLYKMAKYKMINLHQHRKVKQKADIYLLSRMEGNYKSADEDIIFQQYETAFLDAMELLPQKRRLVFEMRNLQELSHDEIAIELNISKSMVKKQCYAASKHVKNYLLHNLGLITSYLLLPSTLLLPLL